MTEDEESEFVSELQKLFSYWRYFRGMYEWSCERMEVWYQQSVEWVEERVLADTIDFETLSSTAVTLVLDTWYQGSFTEEEMGQAVSELITLNQQELVSSLQGQEEYPFFFSVDELEARSLEEVTYSPVAVPLVGGVGREEEIASESGSNGGAGEFHLISCEWMDG
jgi:hypothetical protein